MQQGVMIKVGIGDAYAFIASEGCSYSPDLVHDMSVRAYEMFGQMIREARENGYIAEEDEEYEEPEIAVEAEATEGSEVNSLGAEWRV